MRVLLLEDDVETARSIERGLSLEGHAVDGVGDVASAIARCDAARYDVAVLDLMVPGGTGYDVLAHLQRRGERPAVLVLTARDSVGERVDGLDRGADDYLVKPFSLAELAARLRAIRRRANRGPERLRHRGLELDLVRRACRLGASVLELTRIEFDLLACLLREEGRVVAREQLLREVWRLDFDPGTNVVDVHVHRLRRKLEEAGSAGIVRTLRGRGYARG